MACQSERASGRAGFCSSRAVRRWPCSRREPRSGPGSRACRIVGAYTLIPSAASPPLAARSERQRRSAADDDGGLAAEAPRTVASSPSAWNDAGRRRARRDWREMRLSPTDRRLSRSTVHAFTITAVGMSSGRTPRDRRRRCCGMRSRARLRSASAANSSVLTSSSSGVSRGRAGDGFCVLTMNLRPGKSPDAVQSSAASVGARPDAAIASTDFRLEHLEHRCTPAGPNAPSAQRVARPKQTASAPSANRLDDIRAATEAAVDEERDLAVHGVDDLGQHFERRRP